MALRITSGSTRRIGPILLLNVALGGCGALVGIEPTELAGGVGGAGAAGAAGAAGGVGTGGRGAGAGGDVSGGNGGVGAIAGSAGGATGGFGDGGGAAGDGGIGGTDACSPRFAEESLTSAQLDAITCDDANTDACDGCDCGRARRYLSLDLGDKGTFTVLNDVGAGKTLELWMRQREPGPGIVVTAGVLQLDLTANGIPRCTKSGDEHASPTSARENSWTHVACIAAEGKLTIYVDGIDVAWVSVGEYVTLSPQGIAPVGDVAVEVDEIRYSNVVRYAGSFDPPQRFASDEHTAALWHLDEGTSTAFDSADNRTLRLPADALWGTDDCYDGRFP